MKGTKHMDTERSASILIGGQPYELTLTTRATKEIARRYGGLENLGEKLMKSENFEMALDEVELLTSPLELAGYKTAITEAMYKGTKRNVESEEEGSKNAEVG